MTNRQFLSYNQYSYGAALNVGRQLETLGGEVVGANERLSPWLREQKMLSAIRHKSYQDATLAQATGTYIMGSFWFCSRHNLQPDTEVLGSDMK